MADLHPHDVGCGPAHVRKVAPAPKICTTEGEVDETLQAIITHRYRVMQEYARVVKATAKAEFAARKARAGAAAADLPNLRQLLADFRLMQLRSRMQSGRLAAAFAASDALPKQLYQKRQSWSHCGPLNGVEGAVGCPLEAVARQCEGSNIAPLQAFTASGVTPDAAKAALLLLPDKKPPRLRAFCCLAHLNACALITQQRMAASGASLAQVLDADVAGCVGGHCIAGDAGRGQRLQTKRSWFASVMLRITMVLPVRLTKGYGPVVFTIAVAGWSPYWSVGIGTKACGGLRCSGTVRPRRRRQLPGQSRCCAVALAATLAALATISTAAAVIPAIQPVLGPARSNATTILAAPAQTGCPSGDERRSACRRPENEQTDSSTKPFKMGQKIFRDFLFSDRGDATNSFAR